MTDTTEGQDLEQEPNEQIVEVLPEVEAEARRMGWKPEEEWEGDTDNWLPADKYVDRQERWRKRADTQLQSTVSKQTREIEELKATIDGLGSHLTRATKNAYRKAIKDLEAKADQAAEEGDTDAYRRTKDEMRNLAEEVTAEAAETTKTTKKPAPSPDDDQDFVGWLPDNAWYDPKADGFDVEASAYADSIAHQLGKKGLIGKPFYEGITNEIKKKFPEKFGNTRRRQAPAVEGGGTARRSNGKGYSDLPAEAKKACDRFIKQKVWTDIKDDDSYARKARERYCQEFYEE